MNISDKAINYYAAKYNIDKAALRVCQEAIIISNPPKLVHDGTECVLVPKVLYLTLKESLEQAGYDVSN